MTELKQYKIYYRAFREVSRVVHSKSETDMNEVLEFIVSRTTKGLNAKGAALCILNNEAEYFTIRASCGIDSKYLALKPFKGEKFFPWPNVSNKIHIITDIFNAPRVRFPQEAWDIGIRMMLDVPLIFDKTVFGFIRTYFNAPKEFSDDDLDFMNAVAEQCACAIKHDDKIKVHVMQYNKLATKIDRLSSLGRMAAGIAHEINNPLTGILLYSSNLFKKASKDGPFREGLEIIMQETQRCKATIQGLLDFSREKKPEKIDANINSVIEKALALMENEFHLKRIRIEKELDPKMIDFQVDDNQIEQVIINLLINSTYAVNERGTIRIKTRMDEERKRVYMEIQDNGYGIPDDKLKKIFEPFYTTKPDGTGLGLSVSYGIIKNHNGAINIVSKPGTGTSITVGLPILNKANRKIS